MFRPNLAGLPRLSVQRPRPNEKPPYRSYAFLNPYNLSLLTGAGFVAAATGDWWLGICAAGAEAIWMLFAPDSTFLQRAWFDKRWTAEKAEAKKREQATKFAGLPAQEQQRMLVLRDQQARIFQLAADNPTFTTELLQNDLAKLDGLIDDFLDMAVVCNRWDGHLAAMNFNALEQQIRYYHGQCEALPQDDERHSVAQKNLDVLLTRKERGEELWKNLQTARGQMELMENTFRLLADDIMAMRNASELSERLDDLRTGVEAVRETSRETERLMQSIERA